MSHSKTPLRSLTSLLTLTIAAGCSAGGIELELERLFEVTPASLDFGDVEPSAVQDLPLRITSRTDRDLAISIEPAPGTSDAFDVLIPSLSLAAGASQTIEARFRPRAVGDYEGALIVSDGASTSVTVPLTGRTPITCPVAHLDGQSAAFGNVVIDTTRELRLAIANRASTSITIDAIPSINASPCGRATGDTFCFTFEPNGTTGGDAVLPPESTTELVLRFTPRIAGSRERGEIVLEAGDGCRATIRMEGSGLETGLSCTPASLGFVDVDLGTCRTRAVTCTNRANTDVGITGWALAGSPPDPDFTVAPSRAATLAPEASLDVDVTFCASDRSVSHERLDITTDASNPELRTISIPLSGGACSPALRITPERLDFGLVQLIAPTRRTLTIQNASPDVINIDSLIVDLQGTGAFSAPTAQGGILAPGEVRDLVVEAQPLTAGPVSSAILLASSDSCRPEVEIPLEAEGIALPACSFTLESSIDFGVVPVGRAVRREAYFVNTGANPCLLTEGPVSANTAFTLENPIVGSERVEAGEVRPITVRYRPN